jgi:hypothetical protein
MRNAMQLMRLAQNTEFAVSHQENAYKTIRSRLLCLNLRIYFRAHIALNCGKQPKPGKTKTTPSGHKSFTVPSS